MRKLTWGRKAGMIRYHLFFQSISRKRCTLPHEIPIMAKSTPENPYVGSDSSAIPPWAILSNRQNDGRNEHNTAIEYVTKM
jgi:hypothetical protein